MYGLSTSSKKRVSLSTGLVGDDNENADEAKAVGDNILESMVDQPVGSYSFSQRSKDTGFCCICEDIHRGENRNRPKASVPASPYHGCW